MTMRGIEDGLKYYSKLEISVAWTIQLYKALEKVPALQNTIIYRYLLMMHYCLTGQRLQCSSPLTIATRSGWQSRECCRWSAPEI